MFIDSPVINPTIGLVNNFAHDPALQLSPFPFLDRQEAFFTDPASQRPLSSSFDLQEALSPLFPRESDFSNTYAMSISPNGDERVEPPRHYREPELDENVSKRLWSATRRREEFQVPYEAWKETQKGKLLTLDNLKITKGALSPANLEIMKRDLEIIKGGLFLRYLSVLCN